MEYTATKYSADKLVKAWKNGSLKINDEYQCGSSWSEAQKQGLIDSIFRRYPIPPIFLHEKRTEGLDGTETEADEVVDGQQRIRALADFHADKFELLDPATSGFDCRTACEDYRHQGASGDSLNWMRI